MVDYRLIHDDRDIHFPLDDVSDSLLACALGQEPETDQAGAVVQTWLQTRLDESDSAIARQDPCAYLGAQVVKQIGDPEMLDNLQKSPRLSPKLESLMAGGAA